MCETTSTATHCPPAQATPQLPAPILVIAWGNRSRGADALGPWVLDALRAVWPSACEGLGGQCDDVQWLELHQLQIEVVDDLADRRAVLFIDATLTSAALESADQRNARPHGVAAAVPALPAVQWHRLPPLDRSADGWRYALSHAVSVAQIWALAGHLHPQWGVNGTVLGLGCTAGELALTTASDGPGQAWQPRVDQGVAAALAWLRDTLALQASPPPSSGPSLQARQAER